MTRRAQTQFAVEDGSTEYSRRRKAYDWATRHADQHGWYVENVSDERIVVSDGSLWKEGVEVAVYDAEFDDEHVDHEVQEIWKPSSDAAVGDTIRALWNAGFSALGPNTRLEDPPRHIQVRCNETTVEDARSTVLGVDPEAELLDTRLVTSWDDDE